MKFEEALKDLSEIVKKMEDRNTSLDENVKLLKKGVELSKSCMQILEETKGTVTLLTKELDSLDERAFDVNE